MYAFWPLVFLALIWGIYWFEIEFDFAGKLGVRPRELRGLIGIITGPLFHGDLNHLINNSVPFLMLGTAIFLFYKDLSYKVFFWTYIGSGIWVWSFGRAGNHIGASGLVYALFGFISASGLIRKDRNQLAISLLTLFIYGSMIWGAFPLKPGISWEGHLSGLALGIILAIYFRNEGPKVITPPIPDYDPNVHVFGEEYWKNEKHPNLKPPEPPQGTSEEPPKYIYIYKPKKDAD